MLPTPSNWDDNEEFVGLPGEMEGADGPGAIAAAAFVAACDTC